MSIVPLKKVAIVGAQADQSSSLKQLQRWGKLHIISPDSDGSSNAARLAEEVDQTLGRMYKLSERLRKALRYLDGVPKRKFQVKSDSTTVDSQTLVELVDEILGNQAKRRELQDELDKLREREQSLKPWGNFDFPEGDNIGGQRLWFYLLPHRHKSALSSLTTPWLIVRESHSQLWVVLICENEPTPDILPCDRVHTGRHSLAYIQAKIAELEVRLEDLEAERQKLTRYRQVLENCQTQAEDVTELAQAQKSVTGDQTLFVVHAWVALPDLEQLQGFCQTQGLAILSRDPQALEQPPTLLQNAPAFSGGELLVNFYQTPGYRTWDPSIPLFVSFAIFFAMILSDAGYAALMLLATLVFSRKLQQSETGQRLLPLMLTISALSCVWGVLVGSYFGLSPPEGSLRESLRLVDLYDFNSMMMLSIACGVVHLMLANAQQVWVNRGSPRAWLHRGWLLLLVCAPLFVAMKPQEGIVSTVLVALMVLSGLMICAGASSRPMNTLKNTVFRVLEGLRALTDITKIFGDVLSYLRLFALGLASSSLALTFNDLSDQAFSAESGFGVIGGVMILIVGHLLNIFLGIVSGVVHGLRLNFIEFYQWALYGEGYPFRAFKSKTKEDHV